ncbi:hypothetical protein SAMN06264364_101103 [Quadrisphaera granulorum]|uniref:LysM domain-containing protein n=1 Tax=Quadrisphaera granulorum TaxID=317664 RepID=A0A316AFV0_9ACTN|nr:hypothetical protein [Quadrisphaera granulorum]PWJ56128.1 hypothetical protein BXY45_101103 [Quadrisphaera granulorum]SZE94762.1 hypothetical protein SAMN06264364_101103 [Quadrisphaera granulorum]
MDARAWRIAGSAVVALLALVALVVWRADALAGGWLLALRVTGLVAVAGLLTVVVLAALAALRPPAPPQVLVRVPVSGAPLTTTTPGRAAAPLAALVVLAVATSAPALVVLVLARGSASAAAELAAASQTPSETTTPPETTTPSAPATSSAPPSSSLSQPSIQPAPPQSTAVSPSQLPPAATAGAGCELVVVRGDSLWRLAQAQLGESASAADIDARWRALYAANVDAIGSDPDVLAQGLVLRGCS